MEMNMGELRDEIAHLQIQLERQTNKNKRRKAALKQLNKSVLLTSREASIQRSHADYHRQQHNALMRMYQTVKDELHKMATYAHGREMQALQAGFREPAEHVNTDTNTVQAGTAPGWRGDVAPEKKPGWVARMFGRGVRGVSGA